MSEEPRAKRVIEESDERWGRLRTIVDETSLIRGDFTLTSGRKSSYMFQLRQVTLHPEGSFLIGAIIADFMEAKGLTCTGGLALGAVPVVTAIATASHVNNKPVQVFFVRKEAKTHGAKELVNGYVQAGAEILAVDDVTTTGGSMKKAITGVAEEKGSRVSMAVSIVDREEGATEALAESGITLYSIFRKTDFAV